MKPRRGAGVGQGRGVRSRDDPGRRLTVPMHDTRRLLLPTFGVLAAGLLTGCIGGTFDFRTDDPSGYHACRDVTASRLTEDEEQRERLLDRAAPEAASAQTAAIRDSVDPPVDPDRQENVGHEDVDVYTVDEDALVAACDDAGFRTDWVKLPED